MAVHRLFPGSAVTSAPTTPLSTTAVRRSARLGSPSRKRARVSDSSFDQLPSSSSSLTTPEPTTPRSIRACKRRKTLDGSFSSPPVDNVKTRAGKRKSMIPDDQHHHEPDNHNRVVKKKRKENILNDTLPDTATTSLLKISVNLDTRQRGGKNLRQHDNKSPAQSRPLRTTRSSKSTLSLGLPNSNSKSKPVQLRLKKVLENGSAEVVVHSEPSNGPLSDPSPSLPSNSASSSFTASSRMMTRTMKKLGATAQAQLTGSAHTPTTSKAAPITITLPTPASLPSLSGSDTTNVINPAPTISTNDIQPSTTITNDAQPSTSTTVASSSHMSNPLSMPLSMSMSSLPMSFLNVPLSNPTSLSMPLNMSFLNMPLSMSLSMPLNLSMSTGSMSTTLAPSESELGFGFQPQEEFSGEEGQGEEGKRNVTEREEAVLINGERPLLAPSGSTTNETTTITSPSDISLSSHSHSLDRPSSSLHSQSCVSTTPSTIPTRPAISICISEISQPTSNSSLSPTYPTSVPTSPMYPNPTSPTYSSPLKVVCFPPAPQQLPSLPPAMMVDERENRMKEWDPVDMNMADEHHQQQSQLGMEQGMDIGLSVPVLSFGDQIQGDELRLAQPQELEQEQDHSSLLGPAPQLPSPQQQASSPQLAALPQIQSQPSAPCSSRQYQKKIEYQNYQTPEWTPKIDKERSLWKVACKIRVWEITKRYTPDTIRTVVAQEAHDYYSVHGFPIGYGLIPVRGRKRWWRRDGRKMEEGAGASSDSNLVAYSTSNSDSASSSGSSMVMTPPPSHRDDEFMNEETYSFELVDDDDDMDGLVGGVGTGGLRTMEDEWRYEGFEDDEFGFENYEEEDDDEDEDEDLYDEEDYDDGYDDAVEEVEGDQTDISSNGKKKGVASSITTTPCEDQDQDPDAEGEMEIDIEPFQDPSFNAELSSPPTSPTSPTNSATASSKLKSKSKSTAVVGGEPQSFVSSFYIPPVPPHVQMQMMQMQQEQQLAEEVPALVPSPPDSFTTPLSPSTSTSEGTPTDIMDHTTTTTAVNDNTNDSDSHTPSMQIHLPPASPHPHYHHHHQQLIQLSPSILPLPPPRLDSVRVFILRQSEMGGMKMTGRGTPADRRRSAIWGCGGFTAAATGGSGSKRGLDDGRESESEDEQDSEDEGGKRGRPRLRLMLADHDDIEEPEPRRGRGRQEEEEAAKSRLRLSLPDDDGDTNGDIRMPIVPNGFKCDITESNNDNNDDSDGTTHKPSSSSFVATDQTWDAFLASLDDKSQPQQQQQQQQQQQGEEGTLESSIIAADSDTTTLGQQQLLLHLDNDHHHLSNRYRHRRDVGVITPRLGPPSSSPTSLESSSGGMFLFDQGGVGDGSNTWFGDGVCENGGGVGGSGRNGVGAGSSGTCPSDALALEGFNFPVGPDGSSTLSYALG